MAKLRAIARYSIPIECRGAWRRRGPFTPAGRSPLWQPSSRLVAAPDPATC